MAAYLHNRTWQRERHCYGEYAFFYRFFRFVLQYTLMSTIRLNNHFENYYSGPSNVLVTVRGVAIGQLRFMAFHCCVTSSRLTLIGQSTIDLPSLGSLWNQLTICLQHSLILKHPIVSRELFVKSNKSLRRHDGVTQIAAALWR